MILPAVLVCYGIAAVALCCISASTLHWLLYAWRRPDPDSRVTHRAEVCLHEPRFSFSLIVPARHEERVLGATLNRLSAIDHPAFEIVVVVGDDDRPTRRAADLVAAQRENITVVIDRSWPKTKPKALDTGLAACTGQIVGVFDAEDQVSLDVLRQVDCAFARSSADVVQGGVQLVTPRASWFALRNCLEYYLWFHSRLHAHAAAGFFPLGGNTVFIRRSMLQGAGGWDGECLAEDCELGIRLASRGARMIVSSDPYLSTREETPDTLRSFLRQRTRWNQGYLQVLRKRDWRRLSTRRQKALACYILVFPLLQAASALLIPFAIWTMALIKLPLPLAMLGILPVLISVVVLAAESVAWRECRRAFRLQPRRFDLARLVLSALPYQMILAFAAVRSTCRELIGRRGWVKTSHAGTHLPGAPSVALLREAEA